MKSLQKFIMESLQINEMAEERLNYQMRLGRFLYEIQYHALLILFTKLFPDKRPDFQLRLNHWRDEIKGWLKYFTKTKIKGAAHYNARYKLVIQEISALELIEGNQEDFEKSCRRDYEKEKYHLKMSDHEWRETFDSSRSLWKPLADVIAAGNVEKIDDYIEEYL